MQESWRIIPGTCMRSVTLLNDVKSILPIHPLGSVLVSHWPEASPTRYHKLYRLRDLPENGKKHDPLCRGGPESLH